MHTLPLTIAFRLEYVVTLAQNVNNSILPTFQEKQKTFYPLSFIAPVFEINCFQINFLLYLIRRQTSVSLFHNEKEIKEKLHLLEIYN